MYSYISYAPPEVLTFSKGIVTIQSLQGQIKLATSRAFIMYWTNWEMKYENDGNCRDGCPRLRSMDENQLIDESKKM